MPTWTLLLGLECGRSDQGLLGGGECRGEDPVKALGPPREGQLGRAHEINWKLRI